MAQRPTLARYESRNVLDLARQACRHGGIIFFWLLSLSSICECLKLGLLQNPMVSTYCIAMLREAAQHYNKLRLKNFSVAKWRSWKSSFYPIKSVVFIFIQWGNHFNVNVCVCIFWVRFWIQFSFLFMVWRVCVCMCVSLLQNGLSQVKISFFCCVGGSRESVVDFFDFVFDGHVISRDGKLFD